MAPSLTPQNFYWFFNNQPIVTNADITISNANNLAQDITSAVIVNHAHFTNAGTYSLRIANGVGSTVSSNANLTVLVPPNVVIYFVPSGIALNANGFQIQLFGP
ncbi:MAG TPA: hypothetical protein VH598_05450, partial [Verrucomicrobiae bacterium]|nr:hypothetical protein [Verrucomicrobiae bacterium]